MKEWSNQWNPFNSAKVLLWKDHLVGCAIENYLPPVTVDIDPSNRCNFDCPHCNAYDMIKSSGRDMPGKHMIKLVDFLAEWRDSTIYKTPNSACVSGGGEIYMNKDINVLLERMEHHGMEVGIITNGSLMTDEDINIAARVSRWVGFSLDAATPETYCKVKGMKNQDIFFKVLENIKRLVQKVETIHSKCDVAIKYLITPDNALEIFEAISIAKIIGVKDFHLRPAGWDNLSKVKTKPDYSSMISSINMQIDAGMSLETKNFRVFGIRHKFNPDMTKKINFSRCRAIAMLPTFGADGNVHTCFDMRGRKDLILCRHEPDPSEILKVWNTEYHKDMIRRIDINKCPRCTFGPYNEVVENVIMNDSMCMQFP